MPRRSLAAVMLLLALAIPVRPLRAQDAARPADAELAQKLTFDARVTMGVLENGLRYYIRVNQQPAKRAELRLAVNAGSILEADDQLGLAHFVEHMAFNGTQNFPKQDLVNYLRSIGMRFGADVNAYTSFDETVYMLTIPTDTGTFLAKGIQILGDWASAQTFDPTEIDAERGVVVEEWRLRRGAGARMQEKQFPVLLKDSRYATRLPIGEVDILRTFEHETLRRFYRDWYRPDLMAVVAVGDFDKDEVEKLIREQFSKLPKPSAPTARPSHAVPAHNATYVSVATDREASNSSVVMYSLVPPRDQSTLGAYRHRLAERMYFAMLNARLSEIARLPDAPFAGASLSRGYFVRAADAYTLGAAVKDGGITRGLDAVLTEIERAARFGFTATELEREKINRLRGADQQYATREQRPSASRADEYIRHFLNQEDVVGTEGEYELNKRLIPGIALEEINQIARATPPANNRVILATAPEKEGVAVPTEAQLLAVVTAVKSKTLEPYRDVVMAAPLVAKLPEPSAIVSESKIAELGVTEWKLGNGVRVVLKPTDFMAEQVSLMGTSPGGTSLLPDSLYLSASLASTLMSVGGLGEFSTVDLRKHLTGKIASASASIGSRSESISGSASRKDIDTMLQLVYLRFTAPRKDSTTVAAFLETQKNMMANVGASPQAVYGDTIGVTMSQYHFRARPLVPAMLDDVDLDRAYAIYRDRFADASDFTFFMVGDFDVDSVRPLVQRYLGGLPSLNRKEVGKDVGIRPPSGVVTKTVRRGTEPQSQTYLAFTGPFEYSPQNRQVLASLGEILQNRLLERLRESLGGTYSVSASAGGNREEPHMYTATIRFGSAPDRADELTKAVLAELQALKDNGPTESELDKVKEAQRRTRETSLRQNAFWMGQLSSAYQYGDDPRDVFKHGELVNSVTAEAVRDAARRYFRMDNYVHITLLPTTPTM